MAELSEHLMPTLDSNDATTLEQSVAGVQRKFTQVMTGAHGRQGHLEQKLKQWNNFQVRVHPEHHMELMSHWLLFPKKNEDL